MENLPLQKLSELLRTYGEELYTQPARLEGFLLDHCGSEYRTEISALIVALRSGVVADLRHYPSTTIPGDMADTLAARIGRSGHQDLERANWSVGCWASVLGKTVPAKPAPVSPRRSSPPPVYASASAAQSAPAQTPPPGTPPQGRGVNTNVILTVLLVALGVVSLHFWNAATPPATRVVAETSPTVTPPREPTQPYVSASPSPASSYPVPNTTDANTELRNELAQTRALMQQMEVNEQQARADMQQMKDRQNQTPPPATVETPTYQPPPSPPRRTVELPAGFNDFFKGMWQHQTSNDASVWASDFASSVDYGYKNGGTASRSFIENDRNKLINRYGNRSYTMARIGAPEIVSPEEVNMTYTFTYDYSGKARASGKSRVNLTVRLINDRWQITRMDESVARN